MVTSIFVTETRQMLVDRVVENLEHTVVQTLLRFWVSNIHPGAFPHRIETFELVDLSGIIALLSSHLGGVWGVFGNGI